MPLLSMPWPIRQCVRGSPTLVRRFSRASGKRLRPLAHCRKPQSKSGGRSSRPPASKRSECDLHRCQIGESTVPKQPNPPFQGEVRATVKDSTPWWPPRPKAPVGAPNILVVLFDDVGFSDFGCYGSPIKTPTINRLAAQGLRYTGFHTTAMCSTTRAALLTGRNHHSVGVGCLANFDSGFPGYRGKIAKEAGTLAEMVRPHGYRNYMIGKWHVTPLTEAGATGPFDGWPLARGYDLTADLIDQSIQFLAGHIAERPKAPWLLWLAFGACHAPHQAPSEIIR